MVTLGLIGYPLSHSFSPAYFKAKFEQLGLENYEYRLFPIQDISQLSNLIEKEKDLIALNVTIPYKTSVLPLCKFLSEDVIEIGAANLLLINRNTDGYSLTAYNTDHFGFSESLKNFYPFNSKKALVLGNGGSSKAVQYALQKLQIPFDIASRTVGIPYNEIDMSQYTLVINCTPIGMENFADNSNILLPLDYSSINSSHYFYDLVYNPLHTPMMEEFQKRGAEIKNGLEMLQIQADKAWKVINSSKPNSGNIL